MKILVIDTRKEIVLHSLSITCKADAAWLKTYIDQETQDRGELDRIIIAGGTVRIMEPGDPIPVPVQQPEGRYASGYSYSI